MQTNEKELVEAYRNSSEIEIATLYAQIDSLTDAARVALTREIERRGLSSAHLVKLNAAELRREAKFDRVQELHRKKVASYLLIRRDPKGFIVALAILLGLLLISALLAHR